MKTKAVALLILIAGLVSADAENFLTRDAINFLSNVLGSWIIDWLVNLMAILAILLIIIIFSLLIRFVLLILKKSR